MNHEPNFRKQQKVDDFLLDEPLGAGQDGEVWRATRLLIGKRCAIKFLKSALEDDKRERFEREIRILAQLDHPHIVAIQDRGQAWNPVTEEIVPYYVMEFVSGVPLCEALSSFPGEEQLDAACGLLAQVLSALEVAHSLGISHGDIKSANVLVLPTTRIAKLSDFGFGISSGEAASKRGEYPSSSYRAPGHFNPAQADLYRLGKTFRDCLNRLPELRPERGRSALQALLDGLIATPEGTSIADVVARLKSIPKLAETDRLFFEEMSDAVPELVDLPEKAIRLRDPLHGDVFFTQRVIEIIDTPIFQHLREINSLPSAGFLYPSLSISRFEQALGEYSSLTKALRALVRNSAGDAITSAHLRGALLTSLVRHAGQTPFAAQMQEAMQTWSASPENRAAELLLETPLKDVIAEKWELDPALIGGLVRRSRPDGVLRTPTWSLMSSILDGPLAPSQLDALQRVSFKAGLTVSLDDRLYQGLAASPAGDELVVKESFLSNVEDLLRAKYFLSERVLWHSITRSANRMLISAFADLEMHGADLTSHVALGDSAFLAKCAEEAEKTRADKAAYLLQEYRHRRLFKRALVVDLSAQIAPIDETARREIENTIAQIVGVDSDSAQILLDMPRRFMIQSPSVLLHDERIVSAAELSPGIAVVIEQMGRLASRVALFVSREVRARFAKHGEVVSRLIAERIRVI